MRGNFTSVSVIINGTDVTDKVYSYVRDGDLCLSEESMEISGHISLSQFNTWDTIELYENGVLIQSYYVEEISLEKDVCTIRALSGVKRLKDYFIDSQIFPSGEPSDYWINYIASLVGLSTHFLTSDSGENLYDNISLGMKSAYNSILDICRVNEWYFYVKNDVLYIRDKSSSSSTVYLDDSRVLQYRVLENDEAFRNRFVVWGGHDSNNNFIYYVDQDLNHPYVLDSSDIRSVVLANSMIISSSEAQDVANLMKQNLFKSFITGEISVEGVLTFDLGDYISYTRYSGEGMITGYRVEVSPDSGFVTTLFLDKFCPRMYYIFSTITPTRPRYYASVASSGIFEKYWRDTYWNNINFNLQTPINIVDIKAESDRIYIVDDSLNFYHKLYDDVYWTLAFSGVLSVNPVSSGINIYRLYNYQYDAGTYIGVPALSSDYNNNDFFYLGNAPEPFCITSEGYIGSAFVEFADLSFNIIDSTSVSGNFIYKPGRKIYEDTIVYDIKEPTVYLNDFGSSLPSFGYMRDLGMTPITPMSDDSSFSYVQISLSPDFDFVENNVSCMYLQDYSVLSNNSFSYSIVYKAVLYSNSFTLDLSDGAIYLSSRLASSSDINYYSNFLRSIIFHEGKVLFVSFFTGGPVPQGDIMMRLVAVDITTNEIVCIKDHRIMQFSGDTSSLQFVYGVVPHAFHQNGVVSVMGLEIYDGGSLVEYRKIYIDFPSLDIVNITIPWDSDQIMDYSNSVGYVGADVSFLESARILNELNWEFVGFYRPLRNTFVGYKYFSDFGGTESYNNGPFVSQAKASVGGILLSFTTFDQNDATIIYLYIMDVNGNYVKYTINNVSNQEVSAIPHPDYGFLVYARDLSGSLKYYVANMTSFYSISVDWSSIIDNPDYTLVHPLGWCEHLKCHYARMESNLDGSIEIWHFDLLNSTLISVDSPIVGNIGGNDVYVEKDIHDAFFIYTDFSTGNTYLFYKTSEKKYSLVYPKQSVIKNIVTGEFNIVESDIEIEYYKAYNAAISVGKNGIIKDARSYYDSSGNIGFLKCFSGMTLLGGSFVDHYGHICSLFRADTFSTQDPSLILSDGISVIEIEGNVYRYDVTGNIPSGIILIRSPYEF